MTLNELMDSLIGTADFQVSANERMPEGRPEMAFKAVHYEKISGAVKAGTFYAATREEAYEKAAAHDAKRKEIRQKWRDSAKERRQTSKK